MGGAGGAKLWVREVKRSVGAAGGTLRRWTCARTGRGARGGAVNGDANRAERGHGRGLMEQARARARAADAALARGDPPGPLHGVPFTVKDTLDVAGVIGAMGVPERAGFVPESDATVVARLHAAGGIVLGKTNVPPWGGGIETDNPVYGRANNPYDLSRTPGGSANRRPFTIG